MPRLVIFELHHLGDAVMALPFLRGARRHFQTTVICRPTVAGFLRAALPETHIIAASGGWGSLALAAGRLRLSPADAAACVWADARAHILMRQTRAGLRAGFPMTDTNYYASEPPLRGRRLAFGKILAAAAETLTFGPLLTHPLHRTRFDQHHLEDWTQLARALNFEPEDDIPWIAPGSAPLPENIANFLKNQTGRRLLLVHPGARLATKRWPCFQQLLEKLAPSPDIAALILQPPGEAAPRPCGDRQFRAAAPDWTSLIAIFQAMHAVVCNDSFPAHLAAALGKPVVTIFGSGHPEWFAPYRNAANIAAPEAFASRPDANRRAAPATIRLASITPDHVESRLRHVLNAG